MTVKRMIEKLNKMVTDNPALAEMPCFILLGRDPSAPFVVRVWASITSTLYRKMASPLTNHDKCKTAYQLSRDMELWQSENGTKVPD
jgi:hypothetical protein